MTKEEMYRQVLLVQSKPDGSISQLVTSIPTSGAIVGARMKIKERSDDDWSKDFWEVKEVYSEISYEQIKHLANIHRHYRDKTDI